MIKKRLGYIYKITNIITNKCYIGKTNTNIEKYISIHFTNAEFNIDKNKKYFYNSIRKYGKNNFTWELLYKGFCHHNYLNIKEIYFIFCCNAYKNGYNMTEGGDGRNGDCISGQLNPASKTNMSEEKRKIKSQKGAKTRKERGTDKIGMNKTIKIRTENNSYKTGAIKAVKTKIENGTIISGQDCHLSKTKSTQKEIYNRIQKTVKTRFENNSYKNGQEAPASKTNMSKEKRLLKGQLAAKTRKKKDTQIKGKYHHMVKILYIISPNNDKFESIWNLKNFFALYNLSYYIMQKNINKGIIKQWRYKKDTTNIMKNCVGWEIKSLENPSSYNKKDLILKIIDITHIENIIDIKEMHKKTKKEIITIFNKVNNL